MTCSLDAAVRPPSNSGILSRRPWSSFNTTQTTILKADSRWRVATPTLMPPAKLKILATPWPQTAMALNVPPVAIPIAEAPRPCKARVFLKADTFLDFYPVPYSEMQKIEPEPAGVTTVSCHSPVKVPPAPPPPHHSPSLPVAWALHIGTPMAPNTITHPEGNHVLTKALENYRRKLKTLTPTKRKHAEEFYLLAEEQMLDQAKALVDLRQTPPADDWSRTAIELVQEIQAFRLWAAKTKPLIETSRLEVWGKQAVKDLSKNIPVNSFDTEAGANAFVSRLEGMYQERAGLKIKAEPDADIVLVKTERQTRAKGKAGRGTRALATPRKGKKLIQERLATWQESGYSFVQPVMKEGGVTNVRVDADTAIAKRMSCSFAPARGEPELVRDSPTPSPSPGPSSKRARNSPSPGPSRKRARNSPIVVESEDDYAPSEYHIPLATFQDIRAQVRGISKAFERSQADINDRLIKLFDELTNM
ncbi:hypothetical protein HWV62_32551 [Athelia sp. TMB]|nr:hypothetical protein HWV62_32551 [Athelia sp. TMB]